MKELFYLIFALVPAILWIYYFYKSDKGEPESIRLLLIAFFSGALVVFPAAFVEISITKNLLPNLLFNSDVVPNYFLPVFVLISFGVVAVTEELFKYLSIRFSVYYSDGFNEYADGIIYIVTAALGFAAFENFLYFINFGPDIIIARSIFTPLFHASASSILGHYLIQLKFSKTYKIKVFIAFIISAIIHFIYNFLVYNFTNQNNYWYLLFSIILLFILGWWMIGKFKEAEDLDDKCYNC